MTVYFFTCLMSESGNSLSTVSGYGLDDRAIEVRFPVEAKRYFLWPLCLYQLWSPPSLLSSGYRESFNGGKAWPGRDADYSPHL